MITKATNGHATAVVMVALLLTHPAAACAMRCTLPRPQQGVPKGHTLAEQVAMRQVQLHDDGSTRSGTAALAIEVILAVPP
jgi:hypothetical protein